MLQFCHPQLPIRFRKRALAMDPFGLDPIEPWALDRQGTHHHAAAACLLDLLVVCLDPGPHGLADVSRGIVPDQQQGGCAFGSHAGRQPGAKLDRHRTDRPPSYKAAEHALCIRASQPLTRDRFGLGGVPLRLVVDSV
jgi:hypothetical protein